MIEPLDQIDPDRSIASENEAMPDKKLWSPSLAPFLGRTFAVGEIVLVLLVVAALLAAGLAAVYVRLSPLQTFQDERAALLGSQESKGRADADEGNALLAGLRTLHKELTALLQLERAASKALRDQLHEERVASQALCAQLHEERVALQALYKELEAERLALVETHYGELAPGCRAQAVQNLEKSCEHGSVERGRAQGESRLSHGHEEETKREGIPMLAVSPQNKPSARVAQERARGEEPGARTMEDALARARDPEPGGADVDDNEDTRAWSSAALSRALEAGAGGAARTPQSAPHTIRSVAVAPPASAQPPLSAEPAMRAAGLGRRQSARVATPPAPFQRTATITGMPAVHPPPPAEGARDTIESFPLFSSEPTNDGDRPIEALDMAPPLYSRNPQPSPSVDGLRGLDGVPEAVPGRGLGSEETPGRARAVEHEAGK